MAKRFNRSGVARRPPAPGPPQWRPVAHKFQPASDGDTVAPCSTAPVQSLVTAATVALASGPLPVGLVVNPAPVLSLGGDPVTSAKSEVGRSGPRGGSEGDAVELSAGTSSKIQLGCSLGQAKKDPLGTIDGKNVPGRGDEVADEGGVPSEVKAMEGEPVDGLDAASSDPKGVHDGTCEQVRPQGSLGLVGKDLSGSPEVRESPFSRSLGLTEEGAVSLQVDGKIIQTAEIAPFCGTDLITVLIRRVVKRALCRDGNPLIAGSLDPPEVAFAIQDDGKTILPDKIIPVLERSVGTCGLYPGVSLSSLSGTALLHCEESLPIPSGGAVPPQHGLQSSARCYAAVPRATPQEHLSAAPTSLRSCAAEGGSLDLSTHTGCGKCVGACAQEDAPWSCDAEGGSLDPPARTGSGGSSDEEALQAAELCDLVDKYLPVADGFLTDFGRVGVATKRGRCPRPQCPPVPMQAPRTRSRDAHPPASTGTDSTVSTDPGCLTSPALTVGLTTLGGEDGEVSLSLSSSGHRGFPIEEKLSGVAPESAEPDGAVPAGGGLARRWNQLRKPLEVAPGVPGGDALCEDCPELLSDGAPLGARPKLPAPRLRLTKNVA